MTIETESLADVNDPLLQDLGRMNLNPRSVHELKEHLYKSDDFIAHMVGHQVLSHENEEVDM
jgi:hypothetical protein